MMETYMCVLLAFCMCTQVATMAESDADIRSVLMQLLNKADNKEDTDTLGNEVQDADSPDSTENKVKELLKKMNKEITNIEVNLADQTTDADEDLIMLNKLKTSAEKLTKLQQIEGIKVDIKPDIANELVDELRKLAVKFIERRDNSSSQDTRDWCSRFLKPCGGIDSLCCEYGSFPGAKPFKQCCTFFKVYSPTRPETTRGICLPNPYGEYLPCED